MDYSIIFSLSDKHTRGALCVGLYSQVDKMSLFRGEKEYNGLDCQYLLGKRVYDLVSSGYAGVNIFSERVINLLRENNITGWKATPCKFYNKEGELIDGYSVLSITGRTGKIDDSKSRIVKKQYAEGAPFFDALIGLYPDMTQWDGSDMFAPEGTAITMVTQKVCDLFVKQKITNVMFRKITEIENHRISSV